MTTNTSQEMFFRSAEKSSPILDRCGQALLEKETLEAEDLKRLAADLAPATTDRAVSG